MPSPRKGSRQRGDAQKQSGGNGSQTEDHHKDGGGQTAGGSSLFLLVNGDSDGCRSYGDKKQREGYKYTINFSRETMSDPAFAEKILDIVNKYGLNSSCLAVEIFPLGRRRVSIWAI